VNWKAFLDWETSFIYYRIFVQDRSWLSRHCTYPRIFHFTPLKEITMFAIQSILEPGLWIQSTLRRPNNRDAIFLLPSEVREALSVENTSNCIYSLIIDESDDDSIREFWRMRAFSTFQARDCSNYPTHTRMPSLRKFHLCLV
jgi:hypothetical protein